MKRFIVILIMIICLFPAAAVPALAGEAPGQTPPTVSQPAAPATAAPTPAAAPVPSAPVTQKALDDLKNSLQVGVDTAWVLVTAFLVFFMNLGFAMVESGLCRAKNTVNILAKNFIVFAIASPFCFIGLGLMFGNGSPFVGLEGLFFAGGADNSPAMGDAYKGVYSALSWTGVPMWAKFFFQLVFAGTAATIVSGAVAERIKFHSFIFFSFILVAIMYPVTGHWIWGGGFLQSLGMFDFAGSTVVHSVGGWAALAGMILLGSRAGQVQSRRQGQADLRSQHGPGDHRGIRPVVRLVRVQPRIHHGVGDGAPSPTSPSPPTPRPPWPSSARPWWRG